MTVGECRRPVKDTAKRGMFFFKGHPRDEHDVDKAGEWGEEQKRITAIEERPH